MTRLSVVIPAYNNADFIAETMRSVLDQDYGDFEVIVADHSSTDGTLEVLAQFVDDPRVTILHTPAGGGAQANWRRVTEAAHSELLKLVCGDDILYPGAFMQQVAAFDAYPEVVLVASKRDILDARGVPLLRRRGIDHLVGLVDGESAVRASVRAGLNLLGEPACVMLKAAVLAEAGGWDGAEPYLIDQATYANVLLKGPMVGIETPLAGFRVNAGQWSVALARDQADQARAYHRRIATRRPDVVSPRDVRIGDLRASFNAFLRRAVYFVYARRLRST